MKDSLILYYNYEIRRGDKLIKKTRNQRCWSLIRQFLDLLFWEFAQQGVTFTDTSNTPRTLTQTDTGAKAEEYKRWRLNAAANTNTYGVVIGTGSAAVSISDYQLTSIINHGTSAGQLQHSAVTFGAPTTDAAGTTFIVTRIFTNGSGGSITVSEIGLIAQVVSTSTYYTLIARDLVSPAITLANGESITINYTFTTTV